MKLIARYNRTSYTEKGDIELTLTVDKHFYKSIQKINQERLLEVTINERKSQRSLEQNRLLWKLIHEIDVHENNHTDKDSEMLLYKNLIKMARIKIDHLQGLEETKSMLEQTYRVVEIVEHRATEKANTVVFALYRGTSHFNVSEMKDFIDVTLNYASQVGLEIEYYERELRYEN